MPTELPNFACEFSSEARLTQPTHYGKVAKSLYDLLIKPRGTAPQVKIVDELKQFLFPRIVRRGKNLTDDHIYLSEQFPLASLTGRSALAAAVKNYSFPGFSVPSHFDTKIRHAEVTWVSVDMMYLHVFAGYVANTTDMIMSSAESVGTGNLILLIEVTYQNQDGFGWASMAYFRLSDAIHSCIIPR